MSEVNLDKPIVVTGGNGYMASWIVKFLLDGGYKVRATVRDKSNMHKVGHLLKMGEEHPGKLELFEADLLEEGSYDESMKGCELVIHNAGPFEMWDIGNPKHDLFDPAFGGTKNVLSSVNKTPSVKRVVYTSSITAIYGDSIDSKRATTRDGIFNENEWNSSSRLNYLPYSFSETMAEKEAWRIQRGQKRWDLVSLNCGFCFGPSLTTASTSYSVQFMRSLIDGTTPMVPEIYVPMVDVRDVAKAHVLAATTPTASGRHIIAAEAVSFLDIANALRKKYGQKFPLAKRYIPKPLVYLVVPFMVGGFSWRYARANIGVTVKFDNSYSKNDLGMTYAPLDKAFSEHVEQIVKDKLLD